MQVSCDDTDTSWGAHLHVIVVTPGDIKLEAVRREWHDRTGAYQVHVQRCNDAGDVWRLFRYLLRQDNIPPAYAKLYEAALAGQRRLWQGGAFKKAIEALIAAWVVGAVLAARVWEWGSSPLDNLYRKQVLVFPHLSHLPRRRCYDARASPISARTRG